MNDIKVTLKIDLDQPLGDIFDDILGEMSVLVRAARNHYCEHSNLLLPVNLREQLKKQHIIALLWSTDDVIALRPDLSRNQAWEVLEYAQQIYEPQAGLTSRDIDGYALHLFGPPPQITARIKESLRCVTFGPQVFPYQCFLHDGRCVLIRRDLSGHSVIHSPFSPEDDTPHILPLDRVPGAVFAILERVLAESSEG